MKPYYEEGSVTIYHGDCREVLPTVAAGDLVVTDPPYGIDHDTDYTRFGERSNRTWEAIAGDREDFDPAPLLSLAPCVLFGANYYADRLPHPGGWLVWNKRDELPGNGVLADGELAWHNCGGKTVRVFNWLWWGCYRKGEMGSALHPTQKPVALMRWIVEAFSEPGDLILDPYMGSGPIAEACAQTSRRYVGIEIDERYCEIAAKRCAQEVMDISAC